jgi:hypothetical protein
MITEYLTVVGLALLLNTLRDWKLQTVDERLNSFCMGATIFLMYLVRPPFAVFLALLIMVAIINVALTRKFKTAVGAGDVSALSWIVLGLGIIEYWTLVIFVFMYVVLLGAFELAKRRYNLDPTYRFSGYLFILGAFITAASTIYGR